MNTSKLRWVLIVLAAGFALPTSVSVAGPHSVQLLLATNAMGQANKSQSASDRQEVDGLLKSARKLIKEGNFEEADAQIKRAEKLKVEYSLFHLGDTPKKLRSDWNAAKRTSKRAALARPSQKFAPELPADKYASKKAESPADAKPTGGPVEVLDPREESPFALPDSQGSLTQPPLSQRAENSDEVEMNLGSQLTPQREVSNEPDANPELRRQADSQLLAARRALAVGDVRRATAAVEAAKKLNATYGHHDDTPERVETAVHNYRQVSESASGPQATEAARHQLADLLMDQAQQLMRWRDYEEAERLIRHVQGMRINYGPFEAKPEALLVKIAASRGQSQGASQEAAQPVPGTEAIVGQSPPKRSATRTPAVATPPKGKAYPTTQALYDSNHDSTRNLISSAQEGGQAAEEGEEEVLSSEPVERLPTPDQSARPIPANNSSALQLYRQGEKSLRDRDLPKALEYFRHAYELRDELDAATAQRLQDHLQLLSAPAGGSRGSAKSESLIDKTTSKQQLLLKQLSADVAQKQVAAQKIREKDSKRAMDLLKEARAAVEAAGVEPEARAQLLRRVDKSVGELDKYVTDHRAQIELDNSNKEVLKDVDRRRQAKIEVDDKLAKLVDQFNQLMDEQRYGEAEVLAKRARELDPDNTLVKQLLWQSRFVTRTQRNNNLIDDKEDAAWQALHSVERAAIPVDDSEPYHMPDAKKWEDLTKSRSKRIAEGKNRRSERDLEIERKLKTPVSLKFRNRPLLEVLEQLAKLTDINIHPDPKGLEEEGVSSDTPINIDLSQDVSLKSALHLILEPLHLSYVIKNEVLMITSEQLRDGEVYTVTYSVADLVIPIPNFTPNGRQGLAGALQDAYAISGSGGMGPGTTYLASQDGNQATGVVNPQVLAQMQQLMPGAMGSRGASGGGSMPMGPGGAGGGAQADFDSLIELITTTVKPSTWDEVGGPGSVSEFRNNLSLVISQTQDVHEEIVDLLEQLRRNQDLQVTIEVRFITLNDNFFERIGVDFQFNVVNQNAINPRANGTGPGIGPGNFKEVVGLDTVLGNAPSGIAPNFTPNLELPFRQSSFNLATPQFGQPVEVAHFGFAILSDLEAFLLVNAAQGDRRSNVLQAPKVTLFNGQQASVSDFTQTPFVISVTPVVGDFAAAYQPIITVLSEGTYLSVQAVISNDRRFVRLTVIPFFSQIGDVREFTFSGSKTTTNNTSANKSTGGGGGDSTANTDNSTTSTDGITIQLPNFSIVSVNTTVSVPDGGTVLLGGIKRLSEGRNEFGVPILSKLPYVNRLFKNVGIGRETQSLMMMVTPRIIIQEEEEERLGIQAPP